MRSADSSASDTPPSDEQRYRDLLVAFDQAIAIVAERSVPPVRADTSIADLGVDSLLIFEVVTMMERQAGVELADEDFATIRTVGDFIALLVRLTRPQA